MKLSLATPWTYQAIPELLQTLQQKHTKNLESIVFYQALFAKGPIHTSFELRLVILEHLPTFVSNFAKFPQYVMANN